MSETCETCKFFNPISSVGECRLDPPEVLAGHLVWHLVGKNNWCGEHQRKGKVNEQEL